MHTLPGLVSILRAPTSGVVPARPCPPRPVRAAVLLSLLCFWAGGRAEAGFTLLENFNGLTNGPVHGQNGWVDSATDGRVVADPANAANKVIAVTNTYANVYHALGSLAISNGFTGTVYFRLRWPGSGYSIYAGLTDVATPLPNSVNDFEPHLRCEPATPSLLKARDAGAYDTLFTLQSNVWYQVWMVVNNPRDLFSVYLQGGTLTTQTQLTNIADGEKWFTFRNTAGDGTNTNTSPVANALLCFNLKTTSSHVGPMYVDDVYVDPSGTNLANPLVPVVDTTPPVIVSVDPPAGSTLTALGLVTVTFSETISNTAAAHLLVNGTPATNITGSGAARTWRFAQPSAGAVNLSWAASHTITDLATNRFNGTNAGWSYTLLGADLTPPAINTVTPTAGSSVSSLTSVTVTFTETVSSIEASDLLVNGLPASGISGAGIQRVFTFSQPQPGTVEFTWDGSHAISDAAGNRFQETQPGATWICTLLDKLPPQVASAFPVPGAVVGNLTNIEATFSEWVNGVDAADLRVNGIAATSVSGSGAGPYRFTLAQPSAGTATVTWAGGHGIQDTATPPNAFGGAGWSYTISPAASAPDVVLNEIVAENLTGLLDEDGDSEDWIEIQNRSAASVNLAGWSLSDDTNQPGKWILPARTLTPGAFLVVFASGKDRAPVTPTANLHASFKLGVSGYLGLFNAEVPRRAVSEFAPAYPEQRGDLAWGRLGASGFTYFATPTPGASNSSPVTYSGIVEMPAASAKSGFYDQPFEVVLSCRTAGAQIRYTLDGSAPTEASTPHTAPVSVAGSPARAVVMLRAAAFKAGMLSSPVLTRTFLFPDYVAQQPALPDGFPAIWDSPCSVGNNCTDTVGDYEMDPEVVNSGTNAALIRQALTSIPTVSVVTHTDLLFGPAQGVYVRREDFNQQPINVEFLLPDGSEGFQADCGLEIQGGTSPTDASGDWKCKALSMRLLFRGDFGPVTKLRYPLFPESPVEEFNTLILDAGMNMTWHHMTDADQRNRASYIRDQYTCDLLNEIGNPAHHGRFVHLYLNGLYWGLYNLHERSDESWFADHFGGDKTEYDVLKHYGNASGLQTGDLTAWNAMMTAARSGLTNQANYDTLATQHLDVPAFIDYMLVNLWVGNTDWANHNWYAGRRRAAGALWRFTSWDAEHVCKSVSENRIGVNNATSPGELFQLLRTNAEFRVAFGDHVHRHCFNGGVFFTDTANPIWTEDHPERNHPAAFYMKRIHEIDPSIVAESARWGDAPTSRVNQPYTRDLEFLRELNSMLGLTNSAGNTVNYFPLRNATVLDQFRAVGLYPTIVAPAFSQHGGRVAPGYTLFLTNLQGGGTVWFTTNGADPRVYLSSTVSAQAQAWSGAPLLLNRSLTVKARCLVGTNWSALNEATFEAATLGPRLAVTELNYNPPGGDAYEFIELRNLSPTEFDASGCVFEGVDYAFPPGSRLASGQLVVLANNAGSGGAFASRYPGVGVFGWFGGKLDNGGERLALKRPTGEIIFSLDYDDESGWPKEADGGGYTLESSDAEGDPDAPGNWRASTYLGTPGALSANPSPSVVQLSEVMAWNTNAVPGPSGFPDWIELFNGSAQPVDLGAWSLTDDSNARKFVFPAGTTIDEGGFLVVWCDTNSALPGLHTGFSLDRTGETVSLFNAATSRVDVITFGLQLADLSLGRVGADWTLTTPTPAAPNTAAPTAAPTNLVLNEWLANAPPGGSDWIELFNPAPLPVALRGVTLACSNKLHQIRSLSFLAAGEHLQLFADEKPGIEHLDLTLPSAGGMLLLYDSAAFERDRVSFGAQTEGVSQGRLPDGSATIASFPLSASPGTSNYVASYTGPLLNELMALNRTTLTNSWGHTADWVELRNGGASTFDLAGFRLGKTAEFANAWIIPAGVVMPGNSQRLVWFDNDRPASVNGEPELNTGLALDGGGEVLYLFNPQGQVVDSVAFGPQAPDWSLGRTGTEWRLLAAPTPGGPNSASATLGSATALRLNEWLANPLPGEDDWFELFNSSTLPVALSGLIATDDLSLAGQAKFQLPPLSFIGPLGFTLLKADGHPSDGADHVNFKLDADAGTLRISDASLTPLDTITFGLQTEGVSEGRSPDGAASVTAFACPTPGTSNSGGAVAITAEPQGQLVPPGATAAFSVSATGGGTLRYQWLRNGIPRNGATNATLLLPAVQTGDSGDYQVVITNACSTVTSVVARLTVAPPPQLSGAARAAQGGFEFLLHSQPGVNCAVEKSTNLTHWSAFAELLPTNSPSLIRDPGATNTWPGFYRARLVGP